ncbi:MAG: VOC family protein [Acidobacteria bacterium]|nr:VOC family protein [Acidobacteriota bacterium]
MFSVSAVKSVVQVVRNLEESRVIYESVLGLVRVRTASSGESRTETYALPGDDFGMIRLVENPNASAPVRDVSRPFDFGIMTLNFRTSDIDAALARLQAVGCRPISGILDYNVGKPMREAMLATPTGERLTIIEVGGRVEDVPVFSEAIATVGLVVPSMGESLRFYERGLGLTKAIAFQSSGAPFDSLLGVGRLDKLDFATLNSGKNWTGKVELLELETDANPIQTVASADRTGYLMAAFETDDLDAAVSAGIENGGKVIDRSEAAAVIRAPGGELVEITPALRQ